MTFGKKFRQTTRTLNALWNFSFLTFKLALKRETERERDLMTIIIEEQLQVLLAEFMTQVSANAFDSNDPLY